MIVVLIGMLSLAESKVTVTGKINGEAVKIDLLNKTLRLVYTKCVRAFQIPIRHIDPDSFQNGKGEVTIKSVEPHEYGRETMRGYHILLSTRDASKLCANFFKNRLSRKRRAKVETIADEKNR